MSALVLAGPKFNHLESYVSITPSAAADSLFPVANLVDRNPASIFKFGSITTDPTLIFDIDRLGGFGGFESWSGGSPVGWTESNTGGGNVTQEVVIVHSGSSSAALGVGAPGTASAYQDVVVRAGRESPGGATDYQIVYALRGDGASGTARLRVQNLHNGKYLTSAGAWTSAVTDADSQNAASWLSTDFGFNVEPYSTLRTNTVTLRVTVLNNGTASTAYADSLVIRPIVNFVSIHGHNLGGSSVTVTGSTDNFSSSNISMGTLTIRQPSFYGTVGFPTPLSGNKIQQLKLTFTGTNSAGAIWLGEVVAGQHVTLSRGILMPMTPTLRDTQIRIPMRWGTQTYAMGQAEMRTLPFTYRAETLTHRDEFLNEVYYRSRGGHPLVMVPHDSDSHTDVYYGRLSADLPLEWETRATSKLSAAIEELPFPFVTS